MRRKTTKQRRPVTLDDWSHVLTEIELEAVTDMLCCYDPLDEISADDVLEAIVRWYGGLASIYQIKSVISRVYGVDLREVD